MLHLTFAGVTTALAFIGAAPDRPPCGPANAHTLAANDTTRVYVDGDDVVRGCHRQGTKTTRLGPRAQISKVQVAGRFTAIVRSGRLRVHDLRSGRVTKTARSGGARFMRIKLDRTGIVAYLLQSTTGERPVQVGTTEDPIAFGPSIDPRVLGLARENVAYRRGETYHVDAMWETAAARRTLLKASGVTFTIVRGSLRARRGTRTVSLGAPTSACVSSSGCSGIEAFQLAGRFVAVRDSYYAAGESGGHIRVTDLRSGDRSTRCRSTGLTGGVGGFVLTETGALACALRHGYWKDATFEIRSEGTVIDQGPGIDVDSLHRRGDQLVWTHDGVERTAPLPGRS